MKKSLLILFSLLSSLFCFAQNYYSTTIGTSLNEEGQEFIQDTDSTFLIFGRSQEKEGFLIKINLEGDTIFSKYYPQMSFGKDIIKTSENEYLLLGESGEIIRISSNGNIIWQKKILKSRTNKLLKIDKDHFIVAGSIEVFDQIKEVPDLGLDSVFQADVLIKKFDNEGNCIKTEIINLSSDSDWASDLIFKDDTIYALCTSYLNKYPNIALIKLDTNLQVLNDTVYQNNGIYTGTSFVLNENNEFIVTGVKWKDFTEHRNLFVTKFDAKGNKLWQNDINYDSTDEGIKIIKSKNNDYCILGETDNGENGVTQKRNLILLRVDESGVVKLKKLLDFEGRKMGFSIIEADRNSLFILGTTDYLTHGGIDILLIHCDSTGFFNTGVPQLNILENRLFVFPNPTIGYFRIKSNYVENSIKSFSLYNLMGIKLADYQFHNEEQEYYLNVDNGVYFIELTDINNKKQVTRIIKK